MTRLLGAASRALCAACFWMAAAMVPLLTFGRARVSMTSPPSAALLVIRRNDGKWLVQRTFALCLGAMAWLGVASGVLTLINGRS